MATNPAGAAAPPVRTLACPGCGGSVAIRAAGSTITLACNYCGSLIDVANDDARLIKRHRRKMQELAIPLGTRGTIDGVEWEAIGWLLRGEGGVSWEEYLLFNPYHGYRFLVTDGRGWTFGELLTTVPQPVGRLRAVGRDLFEPFFADGTARVKRVVGEFYWRVAVEETARTSDYVRPGFMLSQEKNAAEETWTLGRLIDSRIIRDQFGAAEPPDWRPGGRPPLPHQPSPWHGTVGAAWLMVFLACFALVVLAPLFGRGGRAVSGEVEVTPQGTERSATLGPVVLTRARQPVTITARAPGVNNQWVDLDYALVDRATQASYEAYGIAEAYSGRDSDGAWSEGSSESVLKVASVPAGTYDLVVDMGAHDWTGASGYYAGQPTAPIRVSVSVAPGGVFWSNVVIALLLLLGPAAWITWRHIRFEMARKGQSDFASTGSGDDD